MQLFEVYFCQGLILDYMDNLELTFPSPHPGTHLLVETRGEAFSVWLEGLPSGNMPRYVIEVADAITNINRTEIPVTNRLELLKLMDIAYEKIHNFYRPLMKSGPHKGKHAPSVELKELYRLTREMSFGYKIAEQFGHHIWATTAGLVPFTLQPHDREKLEQLSGISVNSAVSNKRCQFKENILFTHRGLSGPAILQISSYWQPGEAVVINLLPEIDVADWLKTRQSKQAKSKLKTVLAEVLPKRLLAVLLGTNADKPLQEISSQGFSEIAQQLLNWSIKPNGTEGYRTAEVTLGGVDCNELSSKTMESSKAKGLYFIGEVVDVTGWLGGYNFQWAWSSGWCAGQVV